MSNRLHAEKSLKLIKNATLDWEWWVGYFMAGGVAS